MSVSGIIKQIEVANTYYTIDNEYITSGWVKKSGYWYYGSTGETTAQLIDLSSYLPNDDNEYLILLHGLAHVWQDNKTNEIMVSPARSLTDCDMDVRLANCVTRVKVGQADCAMAFIKVGTERKIVVRWGGTATSSDNGSASINAYAYCKLGKPTNSLSNQLNEVSIANKQYQIGDTTSKVICNSSNIYNGTIAKDSSQIISLNNYLPSDGQSYLCQFSAREQHKTAKTTEESGVITYFCSSDLGKIRIIYRFEQGNSSSTDRADGLFYAIVGSSRSITIYNDSDRTNSSFILEFNWARKIPDIASPTNVISTIKKSNTTYTPFPSEYTDKQWHWLHEGYLFFNSTIGSEKSSNIDFTSWIETNCSSDKGTSTTIEMLFTVTSNTGSASSSEQTCNIAGRSYNSSGTLIEYVNFAYLKSQTGPGSTQKSGRSASIYLVPNSSNKYVLNLYNWAADKSGTIGAYLVAWRWINPNNTISVNII